MPANFVSIISELMKACHRIYKTYVFYFIIVNLLFGVDMNPTNVKSWKSLLLFLSLNFPYGNNYFTPLWDMLIKCVNGLYGCRWLCARWLGCPSCRTSHTSTRERHSSHWRSVNAAAGCCSMASTAPSVTTSSTSGALTRCPALATRWLLNIFCKHKTTFWIET